VKVKEDGRDFDANPKFDRRDDLGKEEIDGGIITWVST
jgi:hypothetical protein